jgi:hypothetical protein
LAGEHTRAEEGAAMYVARLVKNTTVKIRIDGWDANHKNTTRLITVYEANVDEVAAIISKALEQETMKAASREPKP